MSVESDLEPSLPLGIETDGPKISPGEQEQRRCLQRILKQAKPDQKERSVTRKGAQALQQRLILKMRQLDALFEAMFTEEQCKKLEIAGSVRANLKVGKPNEYDVNIPLKLPFENEAEADLKVTASEEDKYAGWYECTFKKEAWKWPVPRARHRKVWRSIFEVVEEGDSGRLRADGIREWMQGLVSRAIKALDLSEKIEESRSGPAVTLSFVEEEMDVSMDIVAVVNIPEKYWKHASGFTGKDLSEANLVPVSPRVAPKDPPPPRNLLKGNFPADDDAQLGSLGCVKDVIRLLKVAKEENSWTPIASFYLKVLCINWCRENQCKEEELSQEQLLHVTVELLGALREAVENQSLPLTLNPRCNLFVKLEPEFCKNVAKRLEKAIKRINFTKERMNREHARKAIYELFQPATSPKILHPGLEKDYSGDTREEDEEEEEEEDYSFW